MIAVAELLGKSLIGDAKIINRLGSNALANYLLVNKGVCKR